MGFRRYGGDVETKNLGGGESKFAGISIFVTFIAGFIAYGTGEVLVVVFTIFFSLALLVADSLRNKSAGNKVKEKRFQMHVEEIFSNYKKGDHEAAKESLRRAKIYGELPLEAIEIENRLSK